MSSIERQITCLESVSKIRDSFAHRIDNNLCEVILQYLSLEDKLRLECVSKQFQRTVFKRHYELRLRSDENCIFNQFKDNSLLLKAIESLLKKCPNITSIDCSNGFTSKVLKDMDYNEFVGLITKYCNNLREFNAPINGINDNTFQEFQQKFGPKLKSINNYLFSLKLLHFNGFPNLEELHVQQGSVILTMESGVVLKRLKKLEIYQILDKNTKHIIDKFKTVRHLTLFCGLWEKWDNQVFTYASRLPELIHFEISLSKINLSDESVFDYIKQMADNCPKLKSIACNVTINWQTFDSDLRRLLSALKEFKQLKRLKLTFDFSREGENQVQPEEGSEHQEDITGMLSFDDFKGFSNITHLNIFFGNHLVNEKLFTNIDINFPNLQKLVIFSTLSLTPEGSTKVADILSRLSKLQTIELEITEQKIAEQLTEDLAKKCKKISKIDVTQGNTNAWLIYFKQQMSRNFNS